MILADAPQRQDAGKLRELQRQLHHWKPWWKTPDRETRLNARTQGNRESYSDSFISGNHDGKLQRGKSAALHQSMISSHALRITARAQSHSATKFKISDANQYRLSDKIGVCFWTVIMESIPLGKRTTGNIFVTERHTRMQFFQISERYPEKWRFPREKYLFKKYEIPSL